MMASLCSPGFMEHVCREAAWRRQPELNRVILVRGVVTGISRYGLIGSANPIPFPAKLYPLKAFRLLMCAVGVSPSRPEAADGLYLRVSAVRRLRACTANLPRIDLQP